MVQQQSGLATELPEQLPVEKEFRLRNVLLRAVLWTLTFLILFLLISAVGVGVFAYQKLNVFAQASGQTPQQLYQTWQAAWQEQTTANPGTILILGTDHVANRGNDPVLTDTMMLARLDANQAQVNLYSFPRDLWLPTYKTKINALYYYSQQRYPGQPTHLVTEAFQTDLGIHVDQVLIVSLDELGTLVDQIGGLPITIQEGFVDPKFPRTDVDIKTVHDPAKLYQTVEFQAGPQTLTGEQVLQFVRSRHSQGDQGTDIARAERQQLVISSLIAVLKNPQFYTHDLKRAGAVYKFYLDHFASIFPPPVLIGQAKLLWPQRNNLKIQPGSPSIFPDNPQGVITHPPVTAAYQQQWVYIVKDQSQLVQEVDKHLGIVP